MRLVLVLLLSMQPVDAAEAASVYSCRLMLLMLVLPLRSWLWGLIKPDPAGAADAAPDAA
jgi:hypothetical protein